MDQKEAIAYLLIEHTKEEATPKVERCLESGDDYAWRDIIRFEFNTEDLLEALLRYDVVLPRLILYEIKTISPFHYAALKGNKDILVSFLDKNVPVDLCLKSGSTALHLASFAGHAEITLLLIEVYKADMSKQDNYGWTALHYASTQGQMEVVKLLIEKGIDVNLRDKDGTSAAFRAQVNGFDEIVSYICEAGDEDELLNIHEKEPDYQYPNSPPIQQESFDDIYSVPNKGKFKEEYKMMHGASQGTESPTASASDDSKDPAESAKKHREGKGKKQKKLERIRRVIRTALTEGEYEQPLGDRRSADDDIYGKEMAGIGIGTLRGVFKEELDKYRQELFSTPTGTLDIFVPVKKDENPYASIDHLGEAPLPPTTGSLRDSTIVEEPEAPPLPPRNQSQASLSDLGLTPEPDFENLNIESPFIKLRGSESSSEALNACVKKLAPVLGPNWKKLAHELPLENGKVKVDNRIKAIEKKFPGQPDKQAAMALAEWRINRNVEANTDSLILALRRMNLNDAIEIVDKASQEFTA